MNIYLERLLNEELLFGLVIRFVGVFTVLFVLMMILYAAGQLFRWYDSRGKEGKDPVPAAAPGGGDAYPGGSVPVPDPPPVHAPSPVPGEVAAAIGMGIRDSALSLPASGLPVVGEVAAAIAMALAAHLQELPGRLARRGDEAPDSPPAESFAEHSPWKLLGRQEALSGSDPWTVRK